jgi:Disaggregatase related
VTEIKIVAGDGTGDFNCDGTDDQEVINKSLAWAHANPGNRIHLKGPFTYNITGQIFVGSDTIWSGDSTAVLKVPDYGCGTTVDNCIFPDTKPVVSQIPGVYPRNLEIYGFEIDGNCQHQATKLGYAHGQPSSSGSGVERLIGIRGVSPTGIQASDISIHNMYMHDAFGEAAHIFYAENVQIYDNFVANHQHDAFFLIEVGGINIVRNNIMEGITDGCFRIDNSQNFKIYENTFKAYSEDNCNGQKPYGHNGMQIANESNKPSFTNNIEVCNNKFLGPSLCGIWLNDQLKKAGTTPQNVRIHHNTFSNEIAWSDWAGWSVGINVGPWGNGIYIDHNTIDSCYNNAIQFNSAITSGCTASVTYNNIINTKGRRTTISGGPALTGYGIVNTVPTSMNVFAECNYMSGNKIGNYYNVKPVSEALDSIPDATIQYPVEDGNPSEYQVIISCLEEELEKYTNGLMQNYTVYNKVD